MLGANDVIVVNNTTNYGIIGKLHIAYKGAGYFAVDFTAETSGTFGTIGINFAIIKVVSS